MALKCAILLPEYEQIKGEMRVVSMVGFILITCTTCIDRLDIGDNKVPPDTIVVEGLITDQPGPYTVKIFNLQSVKDTNLESMTRFPTSRVLLRDDVGNSEILTEVEPGIYRTREDGMQGVVGRSYSLQVTADDGAVYESLPDLLSPSGSLDSIYVKLQDSKNLYQVFVDAHLPTGNNQYVRWKFKNTFRFKTRPDLWEDDNGIPAPWPCSGVIFDFRDGKLKAIKPCTCCECWLSPPEPKPLVSDGQFVVEGYINQREVGTLPITDISFYDKQLIEITQLSLSEQAYAFWKAIEFQIENKNNLFSPIYYKLPSNIRASDPRKQAFGFFYASSVLKGELIVYRKDVPEKLRYEGPENKYPCNALEFSTSRRPINWPD